MLYNRLMHGPLRFILFETWANDVGKKIQQKLRVPMEGDRVSVTEKKSHYSTLDGLLRCVAPLKLSLRTHRDTHNHSSYTLILTRIVYKIDALFSSFAFGFGCAFSGLDHGSNALCFSRFFARWLSQSPCSLDFGLKTYRPNAMHAIKQPIQPNPGWIARCR